MIWFPAWDLGQQLRARREKAKRTVYAVFRGELNEYESIIGIFRKKKRAIAAALSEKTNHGKWELMPFEDCLWEDDGCDYVQVKEMEVQE